MTHPENNFFRTFEIEFSSKNRHFWLVIKFHTLLKNYHFVQKSKVFGKRNKLFEIKFPTKVVILKNCRFDTKKRVLAWISLKYIFFYQKSQFLIHNSIFTKNCHFDTKKVHFWRKWGTVFNFHSRLNLICPVYISMYSRGYSVPSLIGYFFNLKSSRF